LAASSVVFFQSSRTANADFSAFATAASASAAAGALPQGHEQDEAGAGADGVAGKGEASGEGASLAKKQHRPFGGFGEVPGAAADCHRPIERAARRAFGIAV
jgi:hypothetical protein